jgi:hypothetical protein
VGVLEAVDAVEAVDAWRLWTPGGCGRLEAVDAWMLWTLGCVGRGVGSEYTDREVHFTVPPVSRIPGTYIGTRQKSDALAILRQQSLSIWSIPVAGRGLFLIDALFE